MQSSRTGKPVPDYRLYRERLGEAEDFWLHCEPLPDRSRLHRFEIAPHRHPALFQMFRVSEGSGEIFNGEDWITFAAPCLLFIPPGAVHGFRFAPDVDGTVVTALADRLHHLTTGDAGLAAFALAVRIVHPEQAETLARIPGELKSRLVGRNATLEALIGLSVTEAARAWGGDGRAVALSRDAGRMQALDELINVHFRDRRSAAFYAERIGLSVSQLNRLSRLATGQTVQALVEGRMLDAARRELMFTNTPVNRIAESLGFADPAYFNRFFRRKTSATPGAFRARERRRLAS